MIGQQQSRLFVAEVRDRDLRASDCG
jgi:hypothetical protein